MRRYFIVLLLFTTSILTNAFSRYLNTIMGLRGGIKNNRQLASLYWNMLSLIEDMKKLDKRVDNHLRNVLDEHFTIAMISRMEGIDLEQFSAWIFELSNHFVVDYHSMKSMDKLRYDFPAEFNTLCGGKLFQLFQEVVEEDVYDRISIGVQKASMNVFKGKKRVIRGILLSNAIRAYENVYKLIYLYQTEAPQLSFLHKINKTSSENLINLRLHHMKLLWTHLGNFDFSTAFPFVASSYMVLQYSFLISLVLEKQYLTEKVLGEIERFESEVFPMVTRFRPIRSLCLGSMLEVHLVPSSINLTKNGVLLMQDYAGVTVAITTNKEADLEVIAKQFG